MNHDPYRQVLPELGLSIQRFTDSVPGDGAWYLLRNGEQIGRYRSLKAAQEAWQVVIQESGWQAPRREVNAEQLHRREQMERWARNRAG